MCSKETEAPTYLLPAPVSRSHPGLVAAPSSSSCLHLHAVSHAIMHIAGAGIFRIVVLVQVGHMEALGLHSPVSSSQVQLQGA